MGENLKCTDNTKNKYIKNIQKKNDQETLRIFEKIHSKHSKTKNN